jgi:pentapeptide MXKDX repeat protein
MEETGALAKDRSPFREFKMMYKNRIALIVTASTLVFGVAGAPIAVASDSMSTDSTGHMMKPHIGMMKGHAMKGGAMKGHAMKADAMKGDALKGDTPPQ